MEKKYWKSLDTQCPKPKNETAQQDSVSSKSDFIDTLPNTNTKAETSRRDFLKFMGFSVAAATVISSCKNPVHKAIPYLSQPDNVQVGEAQMYASSFYNGHDCADILVKVRDGRPIKIEGNDLSSINHGATNARTQAAILGLYDTKGRLSHPLKNGKQTNWKSTDEEIKTILNKSAASQNQSVLLTPSIISPSTRQLINDFVTVYPHIKWVEYDAISYSGLREAHQKAFGKSLIPTYRFDRARLIVSFGADFLGGWLSPVEYAGQYAERRNLNKPDSPYSYHVQFESGMSISGSQADLRVPIRPSQSGPTILHLYNLLAQKAGKHPPQTKPDHALSEIEKLADQLWTHPSQSIVIAGSNQPAIQYLIIAINQLLKNYSQTLQLDPARLTHRGEDEKLKTLLQEIQKGQVELLMMHNVNPVYDLPGEWHFSQHAKKIKHLIASSCFQNETTAMAHYVLPENHFLEAWNDAQPTSNHFSLQQPVMQKIYNTRPFQESLLQWMNEKPNYLLRIKDLWKKEVFPMQTQHFDFTEFWNTSLQAGVIELPITKKNWTFNNRFLEDSAQQINRIQISNMEVELIESSCLGDGRQANNPWLMELPDPITKLTWNNVAAVPVRWAKEQGLKTGDLILINDQLKMPVLIQAGQAEGSISIALGYGHWQTGKVANAVGQNLYPQVQYTNKHRQYGFSAGRIQPTGENTQLALTQTHHNMEGRPIIKEASYSEWLKNPAAGNPSSGAHHDSLYKKTEFEGHHWGLSVDLNACTGCSACMIACQAENNIPVVGAEEVSKRRSMHWIRLDRYYSAGPENPEVVQQPVMCQHCDQAPCENVCPVAATMHSNEGLNQMAYNRCIGTKYCINNCPYKVRRFNWFRYATNEKFDFHMNDELGRLVLNPDVTVRERGVVEKCSFCVQRIQAVKLLAKKENRAIRDGEIQPACVQACPSKALVFGDLNEPTSAVSKRMNNPRNYALLDELHTLPTVGYQTRIRNKTAKI